MIATVVACFLSAFTIVEGPVPDPYAAVYTWPERVITVEPAYRWDAGVMYHEIGHHVWFECKANEHPYFMDKPERFASAYAEHVLGYDVQHYVVPWIDAVWLDWWFELRSFHWQ